MRSDLRTMGRSSRRAEDVVRGKCMQVHISGLGNRQIYKESLIRNVYTVIMKLGGCKELYQKVALKADKVRWDLRTSR